MNENYNNKVALVTGGSFGIGRATALAFSRQGAIVVVADISESKETMDELQAVGEEAVFIKCDVSKTEDVHGLFAEISKKYGRLDFAFNNAGIEGDTAALQDSSEANWDRVLAVNLKSIYLCMHAAIPVMQKQGGGAIVNCASVAGLMGFAGLPAYVASKHGVVGLTRAAALETAKTGVRINAICPGVIHTAMVDRVIKGDPALEKAYTSMSPIGRMGQPEEIANAVLWLCSDAASFVTGVAMPVDGGMTAG